MTTVDNVVARVLGISAAELRGDLAYQAIWQWDSLRHIQLMHELEAAFGITINPDTMTRLHTVAAIRAFCSGTPAAARANDSEVQVHRGLEDIFIDRTSITRIDGARGTLAHRGYDIHDLVTQVSFEDTAYLLLHGELPDADARADFMHTLAAHRQLPPLAMQCLQMMAKAPPMLALRTAVSALEAAGAEETIRDAGLALITRVPELVMMHHAIRSNRLPLPPAAGGCAARLLHGLMDRAPTPMEIRLFDQDLILHADHCANASSFAARVTIGCRASLYAAVTAALAAFSGTRHGGAAEQVAHLLDTLSGPADAAAYVRRCMDAGIPVMGFGHRIYRTEDPRARHVRASARLLAKAHGRSRDVDIIDALVDALKDYGRHGLAPNVDLYALASYRLLGLPDDLATALFAAGRIAGWVAQALEQHDNNVLIRPRLLYVGTPDRPLPQGTAS